EISPVGKSGCRALLSRSPLRRRRRHVVLMAPVAVPDGILTGVNLGPAQACAARNPAEAFALTRSRGRQYVYHLFKM
uniref:hypothetical protein n=1 Tax=Xanthomonas axonopodis TaxID=53413 RepID=UPI001C266516